MNAASTSLTHGWWPAPSAARPEGKLRAFTHRHDARERGVAMVIALTAIAILSVVLADMHESTGIAYSIAVSQRDELQAEMMAVSGLDLTRLVVSKEPEIRQVVTPIYQSVFGRRPPQLPVWNVAGSILAPFCNYEMAARMSTGIDFGGVDGLGEIDAMCEVTAFAENGKINMNAPLFFRGDDARQIGVQLYSMMGGFQSPSPYDPLFQERDRDGQFSTREVIVGALIDWWDYDQNRTTFDPTTSEISTSGSEDNPYARLDDPYQVKNAPFDSLEELRLVQGIGDDFWATFVEPNPSRPQDRFVTIYGSGLVGANESPPEVMIARICSLLQAQTTLCTNTEEASKFVQLLRTIGNLIPLPLFSSGGDLTNFLEGRGGARGLYPMIQSYLGEGNPLLFTPITLNAQQRRQIAEMFAYSARIISVISTGHAGCIRRDVEFEGEACVDWRASTRISTVMNFHDVWTPPPPNAGRMPALGIYHHYRID